MEELKLIPAPIDNKNLMEDAFEDDVFVDFYQTREHNDKNRRHLVGLVQIRHKECRSCIIADGYVDVFWFYGGNIVSIKILATNEFVEDYDESRDRIFEHYKELFKSWEKDSDIVVRFEQKKDNLDVHFYFKME